MQQQDWQKLEPDPGVLREPCPDPNRLIVWLREISDITALSWERVSNVARAEITEEGAIC